MDREMQEKREQAERELRAAIDRADQALAEVDNMLAAEGWRLVAKIVFYVICCHVAFWLMFDRSAFSF